MPRALVTGATGFVGSNLVAYLRHLGWEVNCLVRDDMCHLHAHVQKNHSKQYKNIKAWMIDTWHRKNHVES
ncbi:MAG: NAD-dependent epimerase/dehydratase family protein, partial [Pirellulales bacterium]|nr:NAD-dependent epimerase/dehydratase family protein [Pirellulales bacterium]